MKSNTSNFSQRKAELNEQVEQIRALLSRDSKLADYFRGELEWLGQREAQWKNDAFRIGLIGITSSGKSTLVNALLGEKLLPEAVRPSSNSLVICEWGERAEAIVYFKAAGKKPHLIPGKAMKNGLRRYADEESNPGNREGVEEIRVRSPHFGLGRGVVLVDTPGLDAFGHDDHEKLTLDVLLPTVDAVLFLTTCKANSDEKVKEYVCLAREHRKPVIVVQNMIDSVVEKLGADGSVSETLSQVLAKHLRRLQSVLQRAGADTVSITQFSALWALQDQRRAKSGLDALIANVRSQLDALAPAIAAGRSAQISRWLEEIIRNEQLAEDPIQLAQHHQQTLDTLQRQARQLDARYVQLEQRLGTAQTAAGRRANELRAATGAINSRSVDEAYALKKAVEDWLRESPAALSQLNKQLMAQIADDCDTLNLRMEDIDLGSRLWRSSGSLNVQTTEKEKKTLKEQSSKWGWLKRKIDVFGAEWGYDEKVTRWTEITDPEAFKSAVHATVEREQAQVIQFVGGAIQRIRALRNQLNAVVDAQQQAVRTKIHGAAEATQRKAVAQQLAALRSELAGAEAVQPQKQAMVSAAQLDDKLREIEVEPATVSIVRLANLIARHRFLEVRDQLLHTLASGSRGHTARVLILGFDPDSLGDFVSRFWFDRLEVDHGKPHGFAALQLQKGEIKEIGLACFNGADDHAHRAVRAFLSQPCILFLVIDIQQIGASESQLERSLGRSGLNLSDNHHPVVLVVQSIRELEQSDTIPEALHELHALAKRRGLSHVGALVNDEEIAYSVLVNWLLTSQQPSRGIVSETQLMESLPPHARNQVGTIVRTWNALQSATF